MDRRRRTRPSARRTLEPRLIRLRVDKVVAEGDGLGRDADGKVVFVEGALPGELVEARVVAESKDYARARIERIIEAHDRRAAPPCPYVAEGCGGCDLQHAANDLQTEIKRSIVEESLRRIAGVPAPEVRTSPTPDGDAGLRTTVRVAAVADHVGFRRRGSNDVVAVDSCLVAHPRINELLPLLELAPGSEAVVRVSASTNDALVWTEPDENLVSGPAVLGPGVHIGARSLLRETIAGVELQVSAPSFFQSSPGAASGLVDAVGRAIGPPSSWSTGPVIDAYGGVGLFSATLVPENRPVVLLEANPSSCADAQTNLANHDARIVEGRVEDWTAESACIVIADPARDGLRARAVEVLTACRPEVFVLVSCDPASLGRDAKLLASAGYRLDYSEVLDVFPHTHHVEAVSRFVRAEMAEVP